VTCLLGDALLDSTSDRDVSGVLDEPPAGASVGAATKGQPSKSRCTDCCAWASKMASPDMQLIEMTSTQCWRFYLRYRRRFRRNDAQLALPS
jgi:hypothetical protein